MQVTCDKNPEGKMEGGNPTDICRMNVQKEGIASTQALRPRERIGGEQQRVVGREVRSSISGHRSKKSWKGEAKAPRASGFTLNEIGSHRSNRIILATVGQIH